MAFQNETNKGRVTKMVDTLHLILKSAQANRAEDHEIVAMLRPLTDELAGLGLAADMPAAAPAPATSALTAGERAALHLADRASLLDLIAALMGRLDAHAAQLDDAP